MRSEKKLLYRVFVYTYVTVITVRLDEKTKKMMKQVKINWSEFIRNAIKSKIEEERRKNIARAVLINERLKRRSRGEPKAEEIIRIFREDLHVRGNSC